MAVRSLIPVISAGILAACHAVPGNVQTVNAAHPFTGCWESEDKLSREVWLQDPSGWLIGYALDRDEEDSILFFEHMRVERDEDARETLVVTGGRDGDAVRFVRDVETSNVFRFVNADHDFPQVITYTPSGDRLDAEISRLDGSDTRNFRKIRCE